MKYTAKILLLGSGELGKEFTISAKRLNCYVIAVDNYERAPAMAVADNFEIINMLDGEVLEATIKKHQPDFIVPEVEAIRTTKLIELEEQGYKVIPTAQATYLTMNRDAIRDLASKELGLRTAQYAYAETLAELESAVTLVGLPCVLKPVMSSSGKGQSVIQTKEEMAKAWDYACNNMRGDQRKVIVEEFIQFDSEITLLTVKQKKAATIFVKPIGHRQEDGDYRESWLPAKITDAQVKQAEAIAKKVTDTLGGYGLFGVEFFITSDEVIFSELSPRPHDTGMVTLISQNLSEFDLHLRAILGVPIPSIDYYGPAASAVILAKVESSEFEITGLEAALAQENTELRIFGKPSTRKNRRMGVALARAETVDEAVSKAVQAASNICVSKA